MLTLELTILNKKQTGVKYLGKYLKPLIYLYIKNKVKLLRA